MLKLKEVVAQHEAGVVIEKEPLMDFLVAQQPGLLSFMYELKDRFGACSMPKYRSVQPHVETHHDKTLDGYVQPFVTYASVVVDQRYDNNRSEQNGTMKPTEEDYKTGL